MINLFGEEIIPPEEYFTNQQRNEWYDKFVEWANQEYNKYSEHNGRFCCGYEWCCDSCEQEEMDGCKDCINTIIAILKEKNIDIDYLDFDFEKWEKLAKGE